jgi:hypothetical protein
LITSSLQWKSNGTRMAPENARQYILPINIPLYMTKKPLF